MIVNDASRIGIDDSIVMLQILALLTDDSKGVIYDHNMCIVRDTVECLILLFPHCHLWPDCKCFTIVNQDHKY